MKKTELERKIYKQALEDLLRSIEVSPVSYKTLLNNANRLYNDFCKIH